MLKVGDVRYQAGVSPGVINGSSKALVMLHIICYSEKNMFCVSWITYSCPPHHLPLSI